jgi:hypothetical protein
MPSQSTLIGAAGEFYVMSELLRRGYIAAMAPEGVPNADIVVTDVEGKRLCSIQVKTRRGVGADGGWHMKERHETIRSDRLFYCFVDFGTAVDARPLVYVMPSALVADVISLVHRKWLGTPGKKGQPHKDGPMRRLLPNYKRTFQNTENPYPLGWLDPFRDGYQVLNLEPTDLGTE